MTVTRLSMVLAMAVSLVVVRPCLAQSTAGSTASAPPVLTPEEMDHFLRQADIVATKSTKKGVTNARRVTLFDGKVRHVNPAVSFGVLVAGRMTVSDFISYAIAQVLGALAGAIVLYVILSGKSAGWDGSLGQNGWGTGYLGQYNLLSAFVFEVVATFLFLVCILGVTQTGSPTQFAGLAIGLTLVAIHIVGINVTGVSVNPARSLGPAIVGVGTNPGALGQVWLFIIAPLIGAGIAGSLFKSGGLLSAEST